VDSRGHDFFTAIEDVFTFIFLIEILFVMAAYWFKPFFKEGWHIFDLFVVTVSIISMIEEGVPVFNPLRLVRIFRMLRLLRKLKKLQRIVVAISASVVPVRPRPDSPSCITLRSRPPCAGRGRCVIRLSSWA
jgi:hypothetical protein